jgi:threonine dehydrogenase-like Zn-dependent dehydrogenase
MQAGDILGHEFMGEVVEVGKASQEPQGRRPRRRAVHDRVRPLLLLQRELWSLCDNSNPNAWMAEKLYGFAAGLFGYSHMTAATPAARRVRRVPFADVGPLKVPDGLEDEQVLFLSDIFPTGYMAAENCDIQPGDTVAVWGCGPVGQFAIRARWLLGAERVIAISKKRPRCMISSNAKRTSASK